MSDLMNLERCCCTLALNGFNEFAKTEGFMDLCENHLRKLLEDDRLICESPDNVLDALILWMTNGEGSVLRGLNLLRPCGSHQYSKTI
jgi:hypothetical protein